MVSVICCEVLLPTGTEPKLRVVADASSVAEPPPEVVPVPLTAIVVGEFVALLATETVAESAPAL